MRQLTKKNRVIRTLQDKTKRLEKRVTDLQTLVEELQNNAMITEEASIHLSVCIIFNNLSMKHFITSLVCFALLCYS